MPRIFSKNSPFLEGSSVDLSQHLVDFCKESAAGSISRLTDRKLAFEDTEFFAAVAPDFPFLQTLEAEEVFLVVSLFVLAESDLNLAITWLFWATDLLIQSLPKKPCFAGF